MPFPLDPHLEHTIERHFVKRKDGFAWTESYFLSAIDHAKSKYDVYWAAIGLRKVGTQESIATLCALLSYPMQDVKCVAILTIAHIARENSTHILSEALLSPSYREKGYALWAIDDAADDRAVPAVLAYLKKNRSKITTGKDSSGILTHAVPFLAKYRHSNSEAQDFLDEIPSFWHKRGEGERKEITRRAPWLVERTERDVPGPAQ